MANIYVRSTDGNNADGGSTWALAKLDLVGAAAIDAAGDTIYVSDAHAESTASAITIALAGTLASPVKVICGDDIAEPPTAVSALGTVTTTSGGITINGVAYIYGLYFKSGLGVSTAAIISLAQTNGNYLSFEECTFHPATTNAGGGNIEVGATAASQKSAMDWNNCDVSFGATAQGIRLNKVAFRWNGGSVLAGGSNIANLLTNVPDLCSAQISGVDFSNCVSTFNLMTSLDAGGLIVFRNCKLPASWTGNIGTVTGKSGRIEMHNCDASDTNYRMRVETYAGSIETETVIVKTSGASDGTTGISWEMISSANAEYPTIVLESGEIAYWNDTTAAAKTLTVDILHDSTTNLKDDEVWLEVQYLGTSGFPLSTFISDAKANVLATAADQSTAGGTWTTTGLTNPNTQQLSVTFTPQEKGYYLAKVMLAKASYTVYVDPLIVVT